MPVEVIAGLKLRAFSEDTTLKNVVKEALILSVKTLEPKEPDWEPLR